jgi:hypothetical protein
MKWGGRGAYSAAAAGKSGPLPCLAIGQGGQVGRVAPRRAGVRAWRGGAGLQTPSAASTASGSENPNSGRKKNGKPFARITAAP